MSGDIPGKSALTPGARFTLMRDFQDATVDGVNSTGGAVGNGRG